MAHNFATSAVQTLRSKLVISVNGPTAVGKTSWSIGLAEYFQTEIISFDSRQFYREIPIGTAAPSTEELSRVKHHFIGHKSVSEAYSAGAYQTDALEKLRTLFLRHDLVIMVGGSGMYLDPVTEGLDEFPPVKSGLREQLEQDLELKGLVYLQTQLKELDRISYDQLDLQNPRRLIRALEVSLSAGEPYSSFLGKRKAPDFFTHLPIQITMDRSLLYERIDSRVQMMESQGLIEEARKVFPLKHLPALQTVGYQELFAYFEGQWDKDTALTEIAKHSRRYAKRQLTWLRKKAIALQFESAMNKSEAFGVLEKIVSEKQSNIK